MAFVYILESLKDGHLYVGTTDFLDDRMDKHNKGYVKSTRNRRPFVLVFSEEFKTLSEARKFEWRLKYTPSGGKLKKRLASKAGGSSNGRTAAFEAVNHGSIPCPPALDGSERSSNWPLGDKSPGSRPKA